MISAIELFWGAEKQQLRFFKLERLETHYQVNSIPTAKLVLVIPGQTIKQLKSAQHDLALCGAGVEARLTLNNGQVGQHEIIFSGYVINQHVNVSRHNMELTLELRHSLQKLLTTHRSQVFTHTTDAAIINDLLKQHGITSLRVDGMATDHEQLIQFRSSDWHFLHSRLKANGVWLFPSSQSVRIGPPELSSLAKDTLNASSTEDYRHMESGQWTFSERRQPATVNVSFWDDLTQSHQTQPGIAMPLGSQAFDPASGTPLSSLPWTYGYSTPMGTRAATTLAQSLLTQLQVGYAKGEFFLSGTLDFSLGETLALSGFAESLDGRGIISGVHQYISRSSGWRTKLTLGDSEPLCAQHRLPGVNGLHIGVIATHEHDNSQMNRIKVRVPVLGNECPALWARFSSPYASNQSGFCFYPQMGDEVVLGFFDDDPCYPVILGAMHSKINQAPVIPGAENPLKALVVHNGEKQFQLAFNTASKTVELAAENDQLLLGQGATLNSETQTTFKADRITLDAQKTHVLGKDSVAITGAKIDLSQ